MCLPHVDLWITVLATICRQGALPDSIHSIYLIPIQIILYLEDFPLLLLEPLFGTLFVADL